MNISQPIRREPHFNFSNTLHMANESSMCYHNMPTSTFYHILGSLSSPPECQEFIAFALTLLPTSCVSEINNLLLPWLASAVDIDVFSVYNLHNINTECVPTPATNVTQTTPINNWIIHSVLQATYMAISQNPSHWVIWWISEWKILAISQNPSHWIFWWTSEW